LPEEITKTLTYDQGKELREHKQFTIDSGMTVTLRIPMLSENEARMNLSMACFGSMFRKEQSLTRSWRGKSSWYSES
jgi:hypothetical protein